MKKFRFAILGAGHIARQFCDAVSRIDGCEVCAVASKSLVRAENFAKENGIKRIILDTPKNTDWHIGSKKK